MRFVLSADSKFRFCYIHACYRLSISVDNSMMQYIIAAELGNYLVKPVCHTLLCYNNYRNCLACNIYCGVGFKTLFS